MNGTALRPCLYFWLLNRFSIDGDTAILLLIGLILLTAAEAYLLGSVNFAIIISKREHDTDIREYGSGNAGSTNMLRIFGRKEAILTMTGDMLKCAVAVVIGGALVDGGEYIAGLFCLLGHIFPCWYKFKGGKGVAVLAMVMLITTPAVFGVELLIFAIILFGTKFMSLASIMSALLYPVLFSSWNTVMDGKIDDFLNLSGLITVLEAVIILVMHKDNIKRLWNKEEPKTELFKKKDKEEKTDKKN